MNSIVGKIETFMEKGGIKKDIALLVISGAALLISIFNKDLLPFDPAWIAIILCGLPIVTEAAIGMITAFDIKADLLVSLALIASVFIGEDFAAGEVAFIMQLGALLEELTVANARAGIEKLVNLSPQTARIITPEGETTVKAEEVKVGDILRVLPGETVPVDGIITKGTTSVNQAVMTGESLPVDKTEGDEVSSGTVNQFGSFDMKAVKVGEDSSIQRMIRLVQSADAGKAKIAGMADRWATWVVVVALTAAVITYLVTGEIIRSVTILVVFCPCALVLATPTAIMAAIGNGAKHGFLVKEGDALERLSSVSEIAFDKTGTLTYGTPEVVNTGTLSEYAEEEIFAYAASAEQYSEHPLGKAVLKSWKMKEKGIKNVEAFEMMPGKGVKCLSEGKIIRAGNLKMLEEAGISTEKGKETEKYIKEGATVIYIAIEEELAGYIVLADTIRKESRAIVSSLSKYSIEGILLTGDHGNAAENTGLKLGINKIHAECLPADKLEIIKEYQRCGNRICMIGDGDRKSVV